jgi:uncharacterized Tic20 family protein
MTEVGPLGTEVLSQGAVLRQSPDIDRPRSTKATVSIVLAVLSLLLGWLFLFVLLTPAAIVIGALSLRDIRRNHALKGRWRARIAIAIAIIAPFFWILIYLAVLTAGAGVGGSLGLD